ncbi:MAG: UbiA family prenyltransferase [Candidatus Helarchaeota archaeon]
MSKLESYIKLLRPQQQYKNALVFLGPIFGLNFLNLDIIWRILNFPLVGPIIFKVTPYDSLFNLNLYITLIIGFFCLCGVSAANYIINDIIDIEKDKLHADKKERPLASDEISVRSAKVLCIVILSISIFAAFYFNPYYFIDQPIFGFLIFPDIIFGFPWSGIMVVLVFATGLLYNLKLKQIAFADVLTISVNYVWRAITGCFLVLIDISAWLIIIIFLAALFISLCKRKADLDLLQEDAQKHKAIYELYTPSLLENFIAISATSFILTYLLYTIQKETYFGIGWMSITLPFAFFFIMRYTYLTYSKHSSSREFQRVFFDKQILLNFMLWGSIVIIVLYFKQIEFLLTLIF